ncbi:MAG TPA: MBL fold metallo-hydrolase [Candidatus Acidoferrum sp.]|nr:MBL fold metallo-hydrolase [Candidatus Acidoferrum sp.]
MQGDVLKPTNTWVWIPSLRAVVAGDIVFNGVHVWLANSNEESRAAWLHSLEQIRALNPRTVVAGHKGRTDLKDTADAVTFTENYIRDFGSAKKSATDSNALIAAMKAKYPNLALACDLGGNLPARYGGQIFLLKLFSTHAHLSRIAAV